MALKQWLRHVMTRCVAGKFHGKILTLGDDSDMSPFKDKGDWNDEIIPEAIRVKRHPHEDSAQLRLQAIVAPKQQEIRKTIFKMETKKKSQMSTG